MDLPEIEDVRRITYNPNDVIVLRFRGRASMDVVERARDQLRVAFPTQKILVLDESVNLDVVTPA